ncbi:uncharacterized protein LOC123662714 [Melitaea cinxia]|uniref:uncharacterized protein LOC123662714 n=1 Tax=Melitaea cinxia TaxID=113334 RepID=UPI001E26F7BD|nr:uncharacterized protein LOC123662714 [Melitaea cinxia]
MAKDTILHEDDYTIHLTENDANVICIEKTYDEQTHLEQDMEMIDTNRKRMLHEADENTEEWQEVTKHAKKKVRVFDNNLEENLIQIGITSNKVLPKQFALAKILRENQIVNVSKVKYINPYKIRITFDTEFSAEKFLACQVFKDLGWRCQKSWEVGISYGIIKNIDKELSEEELIHSLLCDIEVLAVQRLNRRADDGWVPSETIKLTFKGPNIPKYVYLLDLRIKVEQYIFPVTQCSRCWRFGHTAKMCPSNKIICPKCTRNHPNCENNNFMCINCKGNHMPLDKICPIFKKEKRIREIMTEFNCSYLKAISMYVPQSPILPSTNLACSESKPTTKHVYAPTSTVPVICPEIESVDQEIPQTSGTQNTMNKKKKKKKRIKCAENVYADIEVASDSDNSVKSDYCINNDSEENWNCRSLKPKLKLFEDLLIREKVHIAALFLFLSKVLIQILFGQFL